MNEDKLNCEWRAKVSRKKVAYKSDCGKYHTLHTDSFKDSGFKYCPYCGRWIREVK